MTKMVCLIGASLMAHIINQCLFQHGLDTTVKHVSCVDRLTIVLFQLRKDIIKTACKQSCTITFTSEKPSSVLSLMVS